MYLGVGNGAVLAGGALLALLVEVGLLDPLLLGVLVLLVVVWLVPPLLPGALGLVVDAELVAPLLLGALALVEAGEELLVLLAAVVVGFVVFRLEVFIEDGEPPQAARNRIINDTAIE